MALHPLLSQLIKNKRLKVWVLAPTISTDNSNIDYYYDFTQSIKEYTRVFEELEIAWHWQPVHMGNFRRIINKIVKEKGEGEVFPIVLNLCDGDEVNGAPGISVVKLLARKELIYTGADEYFYHITTSKVPMKEAFDIAGVSTGRWQRVSSSAVDGKDLFAKVGCPVILKPAVSGGSMGVGVRNVVETTTELKKMLRLLSEGYRGWDLTADGIIAEEFIEGPEFTAFITGSFNHPEHAEVYTPVERVFHPSLPEKEKFLSFDRLWEIYEDETPMPSNENFYEYRTPEKKLIEPIKKLSWEAFCATRGRGYTRVDLRMDNKTGRLYVLEVNAQCGLSEDEDHTSIGAILRLSNRSFSGAILQILNDAFVRASVKKQTFAPVRKRTRA
jgi:D-alanine-D-alanine ligase